MPDYDFISVVTLVSISFFALIFSVLTIAFWRNRRGRSVVAFFTLMCAAAFVVNLLLRIAPQWETPLTLALDAVAGVLPPLLFHLVSSSRASRLQAAFYALSVLLSCLHGFDDVGWVPVPLSEWIPAATLGATAVLGLVFLNAPERRQRLLYRFLLASTGLAAMANSIYRSPSVALVPDCLVVGFFCTALYYQERLIFFDVLLKRAAFFGLALAGLIVFFILYRTPDPLVIALFLTPLFLLASWIDTGIGALIDRLFLLRCYTPSDAERLFATELQAAATEEQLAARAESCLGEIFRAHVEVRFVPTPLPDESALSMVVELQRPGSPHLGWVHVGKRPSGIPFMSDDRRLFESLGTSLAVILENIRFREEQFRQQKREEQLRLLASRAELKVLRAQINPHFLFNALNAIAGLIPSQPEMADQTIEWLAQVFRYTLHRSEREWVRLDEEVEFVEAYLRVEQARFGERLAVEVLIDPTAAEIPVPAMCIQPIVENALLHGIGRLERPGTIRVCAGLEGGMLNIEVSDNGLGFSPDFALDRSSGHALRNIADRMRGYYGAKAGLGWDCTLQLTRVWLRMPCQMAVDAG